MLFIIAFLLVNPITQKKADIKTKAEYVITVTWPDNNRNDVDTWLQDPRDKVMFYRNKDIGMAHLDRDDLGDLNDIIHLSDGRQVVYPHNQELTTIRGIIPGEWILNLHLYNVRGESNTPVEVKIDKLNPVVETVFFKTITLETKGQEKTVTRFTMSANGDIMTWSKLPKQLIQYAIDPAGPGR
jgi:hypothetical protein